jgi:hypothetical protein
MTWPLVKLALSPPVTSTEQEPGSPALGGAVAGASVSTTLAPAASLAAGAAVAGVGASLEALWSDVPPHAASDPTSKAAAAVAPNRVREVMSASCL